MIYLSLNSKLSEVFFKLKCKMTELQNDLLLQENYNEEIETTNEVVPKQTNPKRKHIQ